MKIRESNYELMRIISMLLIITGHAFSWGGVFRNCTYDVQKIIYFIYAIIMVHVNSYILVSGYFQSKTKFKISKVIKLLLIMWLYRVLITVIGYKLGWFTLTKFEFFWNLSPFAFSDYWFIKVYLVLYCLSPFINKIINKISKKTFQRLIIVMFILCSVAVSFTNQELFNNLRGYSLVNFILLYLIGAYIRMYILTDKKKEKYKIDKNMRKKLIFKSLAIFVICFVINYCIFRIGNRLTIYDGGYKFFGSRITNVFMAYDNPIVIIGSVAFFMFFGLINIKSKFINIISSFCLEIYIIHETSLFRNVLYSIFNLNGTFDSFTIIFKVFLVVVIIFIGCSFIAQIRMLICKIIKNIFYKFNFIKNILIKIENTENKINNWMNV